LPENQRQSSFASTATADCLKGAETAKKENKKATDGKLIEAELFISFVL
jgi:hypothetical protein